MRHDLILLIFVLSLGFILRANADDQKVLDIEIQSSKPMRPDSDSFLAFGNDNSIEGGSLFSTTQREDDKFIIFEKSYDLLAGERRHALIIYVNREPRNLPAQVFVIPIPRKPKQTNWTAWQYPNYFETNAVSNFRFNYIPPDRSTNIPSGSLKLRYKIE